MQCLQWIPGKRIRWAGFAVVGILLLSPLTAAAVPEDCPVIAGGAVCVIEIDAVFDEDTQAILEGLTATFIIDPLLGVPEIFDLSIDSIFPYIPGGGWAPFVSNRSFPGEIDELHFYDVDLSQSQLTELFTDGAVTGVPGLSYWALDEQAGDTATDGIGSLDGTLSRSSFTTSGAAPIPTNPGALELPAYGGRVAIPDSDDSLDVTDSTPFTWAMWIKRTGTSTADPILTKGTGSSINYQIGYIAGLGLFFGHADDFLAHEHLTSPVVPPLDEWMFLAVTYDGAGDLTIFTREVGDLFFKTSSSSEFTFNPDSVSDGELALGSYREIMRSTFDVATVDPQAKIVHFELSNEKVDTTATFEIRKITDDVSEGVFLFETYVITANTQPELVRVFNVHDFDVSQVGAFADDHARAFGTRLVQTSNAVAGQDGFIDTIDRKGGEPDAYEVNVRETVGSVTVGLYDDFLISGVDRELDSIHNRNFVKGAGDMDSAYSWDFELSDAGDTAMLQIRSRIMPLPEPGNLALQGAALTALTALARRRRSS